MYIFVVSSEYSSMSSPHKYTSIRIIWIIDKSIVYRSSIASIEVIGEKKGNQDHII